MPPTCQNEKCETSAAFVVQNKAKLRRYVCEEHVDQTADRMSALGEGCTVQDI